MDCKKGADEQMEIAPPYFMRRKEWYYFDEKEFCYKLTEKAPLLARRSYAEFYKKLNSQGGSK